jgi:serine/threonine protein phosphatase PrpC
MLDGRWQDAGWSGELADPEREAPAAFRYNIRSAGATEAGPVRSENQDNFLDQGELAIWAVADGLGGHFRGDRASRMVVDVLSALEPAPTVSAALGLAMTGLQRVNEDLRRAADGKQESLSGSTVVMLSIRQQEWGVLWAGDSRAYLLRNGVLSALTRDHSAGAAVEEADPNGEPAPPGPPPSTGAVTRAVGAEADLALEQISGEVEPADRFLLCSDGLHGTLDHARLTEIMLAQSAPLQTVQSLLAAATTAGARDNITAVVVDVVAEVQ